MTKTEMNRYNAMRHAWSTAKTAAYRFGGTARQYLAEALRMAWHEIKSAAARKDIVRLLDRAAERTGRSAATSKQTWYLAGLLADAGLDADWCGCGVLDSSASLSKRGASDLIDLLLKQAA